MVLLPVVDCLHFCLSKLIFIADYYRVFFIMYISMNKVNVLCVVAHMLFLGVCFIAIFLRHWCIVAPEYQ